MYHSEDYHLLFHLDSRSRASVSRIFFRDPAMSQHFMNGAFLSRILQDVKSPLVPAIIKAFTSPDSPARPHLRGEITQMKVFLAGALVQPDHNLYSQWVDIDGLMKSKCGGAP